MNSKNNVGIVCCSNGQHISYQRDIDALDKILRELGLIPLYSDYLYEREACYSGSAIERAKALMDFYENDEVCAIFDISGGDIANEILPYLDYDIIAKSSKRFWGYSDLTTIINAIYTKTGNASMLYQIKNLVWDKTGKQISDFAEYVEKELHINPNKLSLLDFDYKFVQGTALEGIVIGGNIRCFLKLAGTEYMPDFTDKVLLLESLGGEVPQMITYLNQLKQMGAFEKINGIILGTFTTMGANDCKPDIIDLVIRYAGDNLPIVKTNFIGHGSDSKAVVVGTAISLKS